MPQWRKIGWLCLGGCLLANSLFQLSHAKRTPDAPANSSLTASNDHASFSQSMQGALEPPRAINRSNLTEEDIFHISIDSKTDHADAAYQSLLWALSVVPRSIKQELWRKNVQIILCDSIAAYKQRSGAKPFHGNFNRVNWTWNNLSGFTQGNRVLVGQTFLNGRTIKSSGLTLLHELGHAFDFTNGYSRRQAWKDAYQLDSAALDGKKYRWADKEVFAQLFSWETRRQASEIRTTDKDYDIAAKMKNCWIVVANDMRSAR